MSPGSASTPIAAAAGNRPGRDCTSHAAGHVVHYIPALRSASGYGSPVSGRLVEVTADGTITIDLDDESRASLWHHDPDRLQVLVAPNDGEVILDEQWAILKTASPYGYYCFSVSRASGRSQCVVKPLRR